MAHFAKIEDGIVREVVVVNNEVITDADNNESEAMGQSFLTDLLGGEWVQCSYNGNPVNGVDRGGYPGIGWSWDGTTFLPPVYPEPEAPIEP